MPKQLTMQFDDDMPRELEVQSGATPSFLWWFDDAKGKTTAEKILDAAQQFRGKTWTWANVCYGNPADVGHLHEIAFEGVLVKVRPATWVQPNNFRVGQE